MFSVHIDTARSWRGGQNQVLLTVLGMRARGHRTVMVAHPGGELRRHAREGLDLIPLAPRSEMDLRAAWQLSRVLGQLKPQVVHAHDPHAVATAALALSLRTPVPRPILVASRRVDFHIRKNAFSRWKYRHVDGFICASNAIRQMLIADGLAARQLITVPEGIDIERVATAPAINLHAEFWLPTHAPIIGNVAALVPHKGHRYLIEAMPLILKEVPDARLVIAGDGELEPVLRTQLKEHHLEKQVILAGFRLDVWSLVRACDLFVLSSVTEGLGTSLLDAMAASLAVVATRAGGIPEVVVDGVTGLLVAPRNVERLAGAIIRLLTDASLRQQMGASGFVRARAQFSADRMVDQTLGAYAELADRARARDTASPPAEAGSRTGPSSQGGTGKSRI